MAARAVVRMDWEACGVPCPATAVDELALNVNSHVTSSQRSGHRRLIWFRYEVELQPAAVLLGITVVQLPRGGVFMQRIATPHSHPLLPGTSKVGPSQSHKAMLGAYVRG